MRVLHHYPLSPSSRLIRLYLSEKKIDFVTKLEVPWERSETYLKLNPSGYPRKSEWLFLPVEKKYLPPKSFTLKLQKKFSPYCTMATWYLWRSIDPDNLPIQY